MKHFEEHAIGERFVIDHIIYEVRPEDSCHGCSLYTEGKCHHKGRFEHCCSGNRQDNQNVIFVQVGESDD